MRVKPITNITNRSERTTELSSAFQPFTLKVSFDSVISTHKIQFVKRIPHDTRFVFQTVSGKFIPREIISIPVLAGDELIAIISLAAVRTYTAASLLLITNLLNTLSARVQGILT